MITQLTIPISGLLIQLQQLLQSLTDEEYAKGIKLLSGATIGQHTRHIIEFFFELNTGYRSGLVNYDERKRDYETETSRECAIAKLQLAIDQLEKEDKLLSLIADYEDNSISPITIITNYRRELAYNLEHTVHHMALLKIGISALTSIALPANFGVALSTIKYRNACAR